MDNIDRWAQNLTKSVYSEWKSKYSFWKPGFKVFYGPVRKNPKLMIVSYNPGGNGKNFESEDLKRFRRGDFSLPKANSYRIKQYTMSRKMQKFFSGHKNLLEKSVTFPIIFFRSPRAKVLKKRIRRQKRKTMEEFSYNKVKEIMFVIKPRVLLVLGFATYKRLKKYILDGNVKSEKSILNNESRRISIRAEWKGIPIFCMMHPTGARIKNTDRNRIRKLFFKIVSQI